MEELVDLTQNGTVYQAVCSCEPFTTTPGAFGTTPGGFCDMAVFKIDFGISHVNANAEALPSAEGCVPFTVNFDNTGTGITYQWDFGDGSPLSTEFEPSHTFTEPGIYEVRLVAFDPEGCLTSDTTYLEIIVEVVKHQKLLSTTKLIARQVKLQYIYRNRWCTNLLRYGRWINV